MTAGAALRSLERTARSYEAGSEERKLALLGVLETGDLRNPSGVLRLHEALCFLRAFPDGPAVLDAVSRMLDAFPRRKDLRRQRRKLRSSGIAGTKLEYPFFWRTAAWLSRRWPERLRVVWGDFDRKEELTELLPLMLPRAEVAALDELDLSPREWIEQLRGPEETDAAFLIRRFRALGGGGPMREMIYERLDIPLCLKPGAGTPSRTRESLPRDKPVFQRGPLRKGRRLLSRELAAPLPVLRPCGPGESRTAVETARRVLCVRSRDLTVFEYADAETVLCADCGGGLEMFLICAVPQRRLLLESVYGYLLLKNGVPIGYGTLSSLFRSTEAAFNVFDTFRGADSGYLLGRVLSAARALFGPGSFSLDPYQLGYDNAEGLRSGAWWFYYKLGFRPRDPGVRKLCRRERARMRRRPGHRSDLKTLRELSSESLFYPASPGRKDVLGRLDIGGLGLRLMRSAGARFGGDREAARTHFGSEAVRLLGLRGLAGWSLGECSAWALWSPLVCELPGIRRWSRENRQALVRVIRAKGGPNEADYVRAFDRHRPLRAAILRLTL